MRIKVANNDIARSFNVCKIDHIFILMSVSCLTDACCTYLEYKDDLNCLCQLSSTINMRCKYNCNPPLRNKQNTYVIKRSM